MINNIDAIMEDWKAFAQSLFPAISISQRKLQDHAKEFIHAVAADIAQPQSLQSQADKSKGLSPENFPALIVAGAQHAHERVAGGYDLEQIISEFRAFRASVLRRWAAYTSGGAGRLQEITRFNEAVDEALASSTKQFARTHTSIINSTSDAIVGKTTTGIITSWNPGAERIFGYTAQEAIGQSTQMLFPAEQVGEELDILARVAQGEQVHSYDTVRMRKDGSKVHVSVTISPITDSEGTIIGASKIARDITQRVLSDTALKASEERFRALAEALPQMVWTARADGFVSWYNQRWYGFTGTTLEQIQGWGWQSVTDPQVLPVILEKWATAIAAGAPFEMEFSLRRADGVFRRFLNRAEPIKDATGQVVEWAGTNTDIDELNGAVEALRTNQALLRQTNADLRETAVENALIAEALKSTATEKSLIAEALYNEKERAQVTLNSIGDAVICTGIDGRLSYFNIAAERLTQWKSAAAMGRQLDEVFHVVDANSRQIVPNIMLHAMESNIVEHLPPWCILIRPDGSELPVEDSCAPIHSRDGEVAGAVMVFQDVSAARALAERLVHQAGHDSLTNLPNRMLLNDRLYQGVSAAHRHQDSLALIFLDVDRFKQVNDSLGHPVGDLLLQSIAARLTACLRESDTVSRHGGDEFIVMLTDIDGPRDAEECAEKLLEALRLPYVLDGHELHVSVSIGIALYPQDGTEAEVLIRNADSAMYEAKEQGRDNYQFYRKELNASAHARQALEVDLRHAIDRRQLELYYQPIIDLHSGVISGAEALLRWQHPTLGVLSPVDFMSIAEESGLIVPIGQWVLRTACAQAREWQLAGMAPLTFSVNVSAVELRSKDFAGRVAAIIVDTHVEPSIIELELTETFLMQDSKSTALVLQSLKNLRLNLALDDFGTGYSSLSYMRRFPIDTLKIDRSFVKDLVSDVDDASVVRAVINLGKSLNMVVVAEGVENREQLSFLKAQQCDKAQGYLFGLPVRAEVLAPRLQRVGAIH